MGFCNVPATFQTLMNSIFMVVIDEASPVYLDDIMGDSENEKEHIENMRMVLNRLQKNQLYVSPRNLNNISAKAFTTLKEALKT